MYGCENWTVKKAERRRIGAFELWCWRRLLRVPWTARRSNQSILKEISPEYSLEGLRLKLKFQYFCHLVWRNDTFEKTLMLGKTEGGRRKGHRGWDSWMASPTWWTWIWASSRSWWWTGKPGVLSPWACKKSDTTEWLNWTTLFVCPYQGQATLWRVMWSRSGETMAPQGNKECDVVPAKHGGWGTGKKKKKVTSPFSKSKWGMCAREALRKTERGERVRGTGSAQWTLVADMRSFCGSGALPATLHSGMVCSIISKNFT